jgi:hypothetical protein
MKQNFSMIGVLLCKRYGFSILLFASRIGMDIHLIFDRKP